VGEAAEVLRKQTEQNVRTAEAIARSVSRQQEGFRALRAGLGPTGTDFFSPFALEQEGMRVAQRTTRQGLEATEDAARQGLRATEQGLRIAEEAAEQAEEVLRQTGKATREAELRAAVLAALQTTDYDGLTVAEISERLDGLTVHQLEQVRELEKNNKNRETLVAQIDRNIRVKNSHPNQRLFEGNAKGRGFYAPALFFVRHPKGSSYWRSSSENFPSSTRVNRPA
jgi:hypothetical protein